MPRYFFDTDDGVRVWRDERGSVLPSAQDAIHKASTLAFDLFYGVPAIGRTTLACFVRNEAGGLVYKLTMDCAGEAGGEPEPG